MGKIEERFNVVKRKPAQTALPWFYRTQLVGFLADVANGHAHRFRDTFAVDLLLAGIPIERVSILLGYQSTRVTEKHYNPGVRSRQEQLEADLERA
jgi:integrase